MEIEQNERRAQANTESNVLSGTNAPVEDEPLFVDDMSDIDMDDILQSSQKEPDESTNANSTGNAAVGHAEPGQIDEYEDEMDAIHEFGDF